MKSTNNNNKNIHWKALAGIAGEKPRMNMNLMEKYRSKIKEINTGENLPILCSDNKRSDTGTDEVSTDYLAPSKVKSRSIPDEPCSICHRWAWWESIYGSIVCGFCHPPADHDLVKSWIQRLNE